MRGGLVVEFVSGSGEGYKTSTFSNPITTDIWPLLIWSATATDRAEPPLSTCLFDDRVRAWSGRQDGRLAQPRLVLDKPHRQYLDGMGDTATTSLNGWKWNYNRPMATV